VREIWVTSDHHLGHGNIVDFAKRPTTRAQHTEFLTDRWNERVQPGDKVYHLGDFTLNGPEDAARYFRGLNGHIYILGNHFHHDRRWLPPDFDNYEYESKNGLIRILYPISVIHPRIEIAGVRVPHIVLCHYPFRRWDRSHYGSWHLYGHTHQTTNPPDPGNFSLNVGVDAWDYYPISLETVVTEMLRRGWHEGWREHE